MDSKFIVKKYDLDKEDADNIKATYGIKAYPTFVFVDGNGKEFSRMLGGARDAKGFIAKINETTDKNNSWEVRNARFKNDPSYAMEHITYLKKCYMSEEADKLLIETFNKRSVEENFNKESLAYYTKNIKDLESPIIKYMLSNKKKVSSVMGEDEYNKFITLKVNSFITGNAYNRKFNETNFRQALKLIGENKALNTTFYKFMNDIQDEFINKEIDPILSAANKYNKKAVTDDRNQIVQCLLRSMAMNKEMAEADKNAIIEFIKRAISYEKDPKMAKTYGYAIDRIEFAKKNKGKDDKSSVMKIRIAN